MAETQRRQPPRAMGKKRDLKSVENTAASSEAVGVGIVLQDAGFGKVVVVGRTGMKEADGDAVSLCGDSSAALLVQDLVRDLEPEATRTLLNRVRGVVGFPPTASVITCSTKTIVPECPWRRSRLQSRRP